jgi:orotate phosphoribosyltransferase
VTGRTSRERLVELLRERSFERKRVTLASGRESDFFIDCKQTILTAEGHALVGELMFEALDGLPRCEAVAGVELGGCPLASAVSLVSFLRGRPLDALYVRKDVKDHGSRKLVEGDRSLRPGLPVVILEDVITTGGSTLKAVAKLRSAGADVVGVVALVDRLEGGAEAIRAGGARDAREGAAGVTGFLPVISICSRRDFLPDSE